MKEKFMRGTCQELAKHPEQIKVKFLRYIDTKDENYSIYEVDTFKLCQALSKCKYTRDEFCKKAVITNTDYKALMLFIQGNNLKNALNQRNFTAPAALQMFQRFASILDNNEFKFIRKISESVLKIEAIATKIGNNQYYESDIIKAVYEDIISLCSILEKSNFYHETGIAGILADYSPMIDKIRNKINQSKLNTDNKVKEKLFHILEEAESMTKSSDIPNVVDRWLEANKNLKYYDAVFQIYHESPEYYRKIVNGKMGNIHFRFIPTEEDFQSEAAYRQAAEKSQKTYAEQYQEEVRKAVYAIFREDFNMK